MVSYKFIIRYDFITQLLLFYNVWAFTWWVSDCEEIVGVNHRRLWDFGNKIYCEKVTPNKSLDGHSISPNNDFLGVPQFLLVQEIPSIEFFCVIFITHEICMYL